MSVDTLKNIVSEVVSRKFTFDIYSKVLPLDLTEEINKIKMTRAQENMIGFIVPSLTKEYYIKRKNDHERTYNDIIETNPILHVKFKEDPYISYGTVVGIRIRFSINSTHKIIGYEFVATYDNCDGSTIDRCIWENERELYSTAMKLKKVAKHLSILEWPIKTLYIETFNLRQKNALKNPYT